MKAIAVGLLLTAANPAFAQTCDLWDRAIDQMSSEQAKQTNDDIQQSVARAVEQSPDAAADTTQATATGPAAASSAVDSPERPHWIALAVEQGLAAENESGGVTISLSPFDWMTDAMPDGYFDDNGRYVATKGLRALTGSLSLGNRGEAFDSDGDGMPNDPANSKSLGDSVSFEIQYQFYGSRDRRDLGELNGYSKDIEAVRSEAIALASKVVQDIRAQPDIADRFDALNDDVEKGNMSCNAAVDKLVSSIAPDRIANFREETESFKRLTDSLVEKIDGSWVWSAAIAATERERYLGRDEIGVSLRGLKGITDNRAFKGSTFVFNLDYSRVESFEATQEDVRAMKLGLEYVSPITAIEVRGKLPARWAVSLSGERNWNAPEGSKTSQAILGWRLEIPISNEVSVPISIKWSNRDELLRDEDEVVGHVGISLNFDGLLANGG